MALPSAGQNQIAGFFAALQDRKFARCRVCIRALERRALRLPEHGLWATYLSGILAFEADQNYAQAEALFAQLLSHDGLDLALRDRVQYALGRCYDIAGRWPEAIATFEALIAVAQPIDQVKAWKHIAITSCRGFNQSDLSADVLTYAVDCCRRALDVLEALPDRSSNLSLLLGSVWNTLGACFMHQGQLDLAMTSYQRDMAICQSLDDAHGLGVSYLNQGEIYHQRGPETWPAALACYQQALQLLGDSQDPVLEADVLANLGALHQASGQPERALHFYDQAINVIEAIRAEVSSEAGRAGFFATVVDTYAHALLLSLHVGDFAGAFAYCERARSRAFLDLLAARSPALSNRVAVSLLTLAEVQAALPDDALLLEYFTTGLTEIALKRAAGPAQRHRFPPARTLIFVVRRDQISVLEAAISPNDLRPAALHGVVELHFLQPERRRWLYDQLIAPVKPFLEDIHRLYIVPHGPLHYIPFQALIAADGKPLLRDGGPAIMYAPSATFLFGRAEAHHAPAALPCLALGYNGEPPTQLYFSEEEARSVARLSGGQVLAGPMPKKATLYATAARYRWLHLSCHGAFNPDQPLESALILAPGERLTALDILDHLQLRCDLVTLSACESGLSRVRRGDELVGLIRAFISVGARALLCTLWRVDERSTRLLIERFYNEVLAGVAFPEALLRAQLYLMRLTRLEARSALVRIIADELLHPAAQEQPLQPPLAPSAQPAMWATPYLKHISDTDISPGAETLHDGADSDLVYADPFYWAPFILVGEP